MFFCSIEIKEATVKKVYVKEGDIVEEVNWLYKNSFKIDFKYDTKQRNKLAHSQPSHMIE